MIGTILVSFTTTIRGQGQTAQLILTQNGLTT